MQDVSLSEYTKSIQCPEHPYEPHEAVLFQYGHRCAGTWECPVTGASDGCEHTKGSELEDSASHYLINGEPQELNNFIAVCTDCKCQTEQD